MGEGGFGVEMGGEEGVDGGGGEDVAFGDVEGEEGEVERAGERSGVGFEVGRRVGAFWLAWGGRRCRGKGGFGVGGSEGVNAGRGEGVGVGIELCGGCDLVADV